MDILKELPVEQWPVLQEKLRKLWPLNLPGYYTLYVSLKYPKVKEAFQFKVYCPYSDMENGFVGVHTNSEQACIMFSLTEDTSKLEEALLKTKRIDWSKRVCIDLLTSLTAQAFDLVTSQMRFDSCEKGFAVMFYLDRTTEPFKDLRVPDNTYLTSVKQEDIGHVDDTWPYKHQGSQHYFTTLASNGLSYGLYSSDTHELLAWVFINEYGFLCHLYSRGSCRRRGYGEYVMKRAVNDLLMEGNDAYAYVVHGNDKPLSIFKGLGFKHADESAFLYVKK